MASEEGVKIAGQNDPKILADKLDNEFAGDKTNVWASSEWFRAFTKETAAPSLKIYQQAVAQTLVWLEPFQKRLAENAEIIHRLSQHNFIMPNIAAIKPMLKAMEESAAAVGKLYDWPQELTLPPPIPPRISEAVQRNEIVKEIRALRGELEKLTDTKNPTEYSSNGNQKDGNAPKLKSIHLVSNSLEPASVIFLVLDGSFGNPIRCEVKNDEGKPTYMKKFYNVAYFVDAPGKRVPYDKTLANSINNDLFKKPRVAQHMKANRLQKPTLVQKSADNTLILTGEVLVKTELVKNIPQEFQSQYIDKTR